MIWDMEKTEFFKGKCEEKKTSTRSSIVNMHLKTNNQK